MDRTKAGASVPVTESAAAKAARRREVVTHTTEGTASSPSVLVSNGELFTVRDALPSTAGPEQEQTDGD